MERLRSRYIPGRGVSHRAERRLGHRLQCPMLTFVSVTQQFNTTTSMGRLTLNILLSFAQFEREVIGERIRDKFAASRNKGIWMGGWPPLGYEVENRRLVVVERQAGSCAGSSTVSPRPARRSPWRAS
jgi:DNA invertase Pin-like site-specific DNA recombinase